MKIHFTRRKIAYEELILYQWMPRVDYVQVLGYHNLEYNTGADPGFQVRGAHLKKLREYILKVHILVSSEHKLCQI